MTVIRIGAVLLLGLTANTGAAECIPAELEARSMVFDRMPPAPPDPALQPVVPSCLQGLSRPDQENCPRDELATFAQEIEIWAEALNTYVTETNRFANELAVFANSAVEYAQLSRSFADTALDYAKCEAEALILPGGD